MSLGLLREPFTCLRVAFIARLLQVRETFGPVLRKAVANEVHESQI